jgi:GxxExxY protein
MSPETSEQLLEQELTSSVIGAFYDVFNELGFGYREYLYSLAMERALLTIGHRVAREVGVMVYFRGEALTRQTLDMVVDERLVVEIKSTERLHPESTRQLFGYLCSTNLEVGLLLHFGREPKFHRVICENRLKRRNAPIQRVD